jgi:hypothetical protein
MRSPYARIGSLALAVALAGCGGDDSFSPTVETVAGSYQATVFTVTSTNGTTNLLALGATVTITLAPDGTTTGQLFVPDGAEGGGDLEADLAGTWSLSGRTVTFSQAADTFIQDAEFTVAVNSLETNTDFNGVAVRLALAKTG